MCTIKRRCTAGGTRKRRVPSPPASKQRPLTFSSRPGRSVILWSARADVHLRSLDLCEYIIYCSAAQSTDVLSTICMHVVCVCASKNSAGGSVLLTKQHNGILNWVRCKKGRKKATRVWMLSAMTPNE